MRAKGLKGFLLLCGENFTGNLRRFKRGFENILKDL